MPQDFSQSMAQDPIVKEYRSEIARLRMATRWMWGFAALNFIALTSNILSIMGII